MDSAKKEVSPEKKSLADISEIELKAAVYDQGSIIMEIQKALQLQTEKPMRLIEEAKSKIREINNEIARRAQSKK